MSSKSNKGFKPDGHAPETTSTSLVQLVKARDQQAWTRLVGLYSPLVYSWCRRCGLRAEDAADLLQEVSRAVASGISGFRHDRPEDTFRGWLRVIARNRIRDHFRQQRGHLEAVGGTDAYERFLDVAADDSQESDTQVPLVGLFL